MYVEKYTMFMKHRNMQVYQCCLFFVAVVDVVVVVLKINSVHHKLTKAARLVFLPSL